MLDEIEELQDNLNDSILSEPVIQTEKKKS
jgi:hypothetical protein